MKGEKRRPSMGTRRGDWSQVDTQGRGQVASWIVLAAQTAGTSLGLSGCPARRLGLLVCKMGPSATPWLNKFPGIECEEAGWSRWILMVFLLQSVSFP